MNKLSYGPSNTGRSGVFGWYWGATDGGSFYIEGHKAWLAVPKSANVPMRSYDMDGEPVDMMDMKISSKDEDVYYDLQGHCLLKPISKGVYIHKGRKIIIR